MHFSLSRFSAILAPETRTRFNSTSLDRCRSHTISPSYTKGVTLYMQPGISSRTDDPEVRWKHGRGVFWRRKDLARP